MGEDVSPRATPRHAGGEAHGTFARAAAQSHPLISVPQNPNSELELRNAREAARAIGLQVHILNANNARDFEPAFAALVEKRAGALIVGGSALFFSSRDQLIALAVRHGVPTIYDQREYVKAGGLISYGSSIADAYRLTGVYVGRILKGEKPADLPVQQSVARDVSPAW